MQLVEKAATCRLSWHGTVPSKKNRWRWWGRSGKVGLDAAGRDRVRGLEWELRAQWARPPVERAEMVWLRVPVRPQQDLDGAATTVLDALVRAGVLADDSSSRLRMLVIMAAPPEAQGEVRIWEAER